MQSVSAHVMGKNRLLVRAGSSFAIAEKGLSGPVVRMSVSNYPNVRCIRAGPDGDHFSFYNDHPGEAFILLDCDGSEVYSRRINTDKALCHDVRFSPDGEVVAFFDDFEGFYRIHLYNFKKKYETEYMTFTPRRIFSDPELRYFGVMKEPGKIEIVDRHRTVRKTFDSPSGENALFGLEKKYAGLIRVDDESVELYSLGQSSPRLTHRMSLDIMRGMHPKPYGMDNTYVEPHGDLGLLRVSSTDEARVFHRREGIVWSGYAMAAHHYEAGILVQDRSTGEIVSINDDGSRETIVDPEAGKSAAVCGFCRGELTHAHIAFDGQSIFVSSRTISLATKEAVAGWEHKFLSSELCILPNDIVSP